MSGNNGKDADSEKETYSDASILSLNQEHSRNGPNLWCPDCICVYTFSCVLGLFGNCPLLALVGTVKVLKCLLLPFASFCVCFFFVFL